MNNGFSFAVRILFGRSPKRTLLRLIILLLLLPPLVKFVARPVLARGISMEPTIRDGQFMLACPIKYIRTAPHRGNLVLVRTTGHKILYLKRVLGLPNEHIAFEEGLLLVNGQPVPEPYLSEPGHWTIPGVKLGVDEYYIAGDNRNTNPQHHTLGIVGRTQIEGGLWLK